MPHRVGEDVVRPEFRQKENEGHQHRERKHVALRAGLNRVPNIFYGHVPRGPRCRRRDSSGIYKYN